MVSADISIFAKPCTYQRTPVLRYPHLVRASSLIRGEQISSYLRCKLNPTSGYEGDVCIHVKPPGIGSVRDGDWVDIMDASHILTWLKDRPGVNAIAFSDMTFDQYCQLIDNNMVVIPQHHCNFKRELRDRGVVDTVGFIGGEIGFHYNPDEMRKLVEGAGFKFLFVPRYKTREDVVDFYRQIDIQITWCSPKLQAKAPLKITNAASFGIPTVAYPQECYKEVGERYIPVHTVYELVDELTKLRDLDYYGYWVNRIIPWSEKYHISKIAELYRRLN